MSGVRWTIKRKLLALGAATFLPLSLLLAFWVWWEVQEHTKDAEAELTLASRQAAGQVELLLGEVTRLLRVLAQSSAVRRRQIDRIEELFRQVTAEHPELQGLIAVTADGRTFASAPEPAGAPATMADRPWFKQVLATAKPVVGGFLIGRITGQPVAVVAVPLRAGDGAPTGALAAGVSLRQLHLLFESLPLARGRMVTVVDGEGVVLSHAPKAEGWIGRRLPPAAALPAGPALVKKLAWFEGGARVAAVAPVEGAGWRVLVGIPRASLEARAWGEVRAIAVPLFVLLAVSSYAALLIAMRVWRPLRALADAAKHLPREEEYIPIRVDSTDEVGELAEAFNSMAAQVGEARSRLEQRVAEQTALSEAGRLLTSILELPEVLQRLTELAQARLGADIVRIWLHEAPSGELHLYAHTGVTRPGEEYRRRFGPGEGLVGWIMEHREPLILADCQSDPRLTNREWIEAEGLHAFLGIPILLEDMLVGILACMSRERGKFFSEEMALAELFTAPAAVAIRNARLYEELKERNLQIETLHIAARALATERETDRLLQRIVETARKLLDAGYGALAVLQDNGRIGQFFTAGLAPEARERIGRLPEGRGLLGYVFKQGQPLRLNDLTTHPAATGFPPGHPPMRSLLAMPIRFRDEIVGALYLTEKPGGFTAADEALLATLCADAAVAIENAQLYRRAEERAQKLQAFGTLVQFMTSAVDSRQVFQAVAKAATTLTGAKLTRVWVADPDARALRVQGGFGLDPKLLQAMSDVPVLPYGVGLGGRVFESRKSEYVRDIQQDPRWRDQKLAKEAGLHAYAGIPLITEGQVVGVLSILLGEQRPFTPEEKEVLDLLAGQAAIAIETARLVEKLNRAMEELRAAQEELVRGETLRAVGVLAAGVAHHLNNLLAVILGQIQLLLERVQDPEIRSSLEIVEQTTRDGAEVVRRVQRFTRVQPIAKTVLVDLNACAREVLELTRPRWQDEALARGIRINARLQPGEIPMVAGEPAALREVLMNLLLNAIEALPEGGRITIKTWASDHRIHCAVADTGVGMSAEVRQQALEPFFTTKGPRSTGLGLSVSHGIIKRHQGELTIESAEGKGTTATIRLPGAQAMPAAVPEALAAQVLPLGILVIEDESTVRQTLVKMLTSQGHRVIQADGGEEGLARLTAEERVDLVLTDLGMRGMTGWEVARAVKARWPHLPVGLITGWGEEPEATAEERRGVDFVIPKPVTLEALREALARCAPRPAPR